MVRPVSNGCQVSLKSEQNTTSEFPICGKPYTRNLDHVFSHEIKEESCCFVTMFESNRLNV